jgi:D-glycero-D-manno-heptose 1,7-bisphosphate phosphatase
MKKIDLVILAGGRGKRLGAITSKTPKPLIKVNGLPFIQHLINFYSKFNFENIYIIAGYKGELIKKKFHNKIFNLIKITCCIEKKRKDTGGALFEVKNKIKNDFILVNGDSFINVNLQLFFNKRKINYNYIFLNNNTTYKENKKLINLDINKKKIVFFNKNSKLMNSGVYYFKKNLLRDIKNKKISLENDILTELIKQKKLKGIKTNENVIDIGIKKNFIKAEKLLLQKLKRPAIFFDRDGVINHDNKYVYKYNDFILKKNILNFLTKLKKYYLFIVTNQSGIARGFYKEKDFYLLHKKLKKDFIKKNIFFNDILFCPHHPEGIINKYKKKCLCRKPGNQMLKKIISSWNIDLKKSYMIGDSKSDEDSAKKTKIKFIYSNKNFLKEIK